MTGEDIIMMSQEELKRLHVIRKAMDKAIFQHEAGHILGITTRQVRRLVKRVCLYGDKGIIHKARGRPSNRAKPDRIRDKVLRLCREKYQGFGPTLASEKLFERDKIKLNDETLRLWFIEDNITYRKRKKRPHRQWRQRKACFGEMVQMDGSHHDWFEGRGRPCVLMGFIDDATGRPFGRFYAYEGTLPAMASFKHYIKKYGIPMSLYLDKHKTYKSSKKPSIEDELKNQESLSQFARAARELGVNVIYADSPQAKGRIERLFGTFQDRLIKEMRLKGIKSIEEGNRFLEWYLPFYARRFAIEPARSTNLHRPLPKSANIDRILCKKTERALRNDFTVAHDNKLYQIENNIRAKKVTIEEKTNGSVLIKHRGAPLKFRQIQARPKRAAIKKDFYVFPKKAHVPSQDNPWRAFKINPRSAQEQEKRELELAKI